MLENLPKEYQSIDKPKQHIAKSIKHEMDIKGLSLRKLADQIDGMSYTQISRITRQENYNIETLLKLLSALDLEVKIEKRTKSSLK